MKEKQISYIQKTLGISVEYHHWKGELDLPYYITERYDMRLVKLDTIYCIFIWPKEKLNQIGSLKKQIRRIQIEEELPVVFVFDRIDKYHRDAFVSAHIPFIVTDSQLYLPFMGTYLQEKYFHEIKSSDSFLPFTQLLLFYWYYHNENSIYMSDMIKKLKCSAMTMTRAFRQLEETGLFKCGKTGVQRILTGPCQPEMVLSELEERLISPVANVIFVDKKDLDKQLDQNQIFLSGNTALSFMGIAADKDIPCYAIYKKNTYISGSSELLNAETQVRIELWKYDPSILSNAIQSNDNVVDPLSLALSKNESVDYYLKKEIL